MCGLWKSNTSKVLKCGASEGWRSYRVTNEEIFQRVDEERNILQTIKRRKANSTDHTLRRNCLLKHVTEEKTEERIGVTRRRRRCKQLLDGL
jgi:hypothetical protein